MKKFYSLKRNLFSGKKIIINVARFNMNETYNPSGFAAEFPAEIPKL